MIDSCKDCEACCCKTGHGRLRKVSSEEYLEHFGEAEAYGTRCKELDEKNRCRLWGTPDFPIECRTYVCQCRKFSKEELETIENISDKECFNCGCSWIVNYEERPGVWFYHCETCGKDEWWFLFDNPEGEIKK